MNSRRVVPAALYRTPPTRENGRKNRRALRGVHGRISPPTHRRGLAFLAAGAIALIAIGCTWRKDASELHYLGGQGEEYYKGIATSIEYPNTEDIRPDEISMSIEPHTIADRRKDKVWDLSLAEAIKLALQNNKIIRVAGAFNSAPPNGLMASPNTQQSIYDSALQETGVLFGGLGVEAALANFDAQLAMSMIWGNNNTISNSAVQNSGAAAGQVLSLDTGAFNASLSKTFANGGQVTLTDVTNYVGSSAPGQLFPSTYTGFVRIGYTQPLWAGSGVEFTRIAGPIGNGFTGVTGVSQGVAIARINEDMALAQFEISSLNLLRDTENLYWNLYLQYRLFHTAVVAHNSALRSWREAKTKLDIGGITGFTPVDEAQARDQLYSTRATAEQTLSALYTAETSLRRLLGQPVNDGRVMRPSDEPITAKFIPDWYNSLTEGLTRRVELRNQKWAIKSLELQLRAAKSLVNPQLNFVSYYQVNAFGDELITSQSQLTQPGSSMFASLAEANQTGWNIGFNMSMPIGFRQAHLQVENYEWRLAKARAGLSEQELEVAHELAAAFQNVAVQYQTAQSNFNRRMASERAVQIYEAQYQLGTTTLAFVLQAQSSLAAAESNYYTSLANYAEAIMDLNYRKGTLLDYHNVTLAESEWTPSAYRDAARRAWARAHAFKADFLCTYPEEQQLQPGAPIPVGNPTSEVPAEPNPVPPVPAGPAAPTAPPASPTIPMTPAAPTAPPAEPYDPAPAGSKTSTNDPTRQPAAARTVNY